MDWRAFEVIPGALMGQDAVHRALTTRKRHEEIYIGGNLGFEGVIFTSKTTVSSR